MNGNFLRLDKVLRARVQRELAVGESVQWAGTPDWRANWRSLTATGVFSLFWTAITGFFFLALVRAALGFVPFKMSGGPVSPLWTLPFLLLLLPFVVIGVALLYHVWRELGAGARRVHAITDRRLLTVEVDRRKPIENRPRDTVNFVRSSERRDGSGTLSIACGGVADAEGSRRPETITWAGVPAVGAAQALLDERRTSAAARPRAPQPSRPLPPPVTLRGLPDDLARAVAHETVGERIAWFSQPDPVTSAKIAMLVSLFALPWLYFTIKWEATTVALLLMEIERAKTNVPIVWLSVFSLWGLPFIGVGLGMLATPLWVWRRARSTVYLVTDRRALTVTMSRKSGTSVASVEPGRIVSVKRTDGFGGRGTVSILLGRTIDSDGDEVDLAETFWLVDGAERAEELIADLRQEAGEDRAA